LKTDASDIAVPITFSYHVYPERTVLLLFFGIRWSPAMGAPRALASDGVAWLTREDLIDSAMPAANRPIVNAIARGWTMPLRNN
jgi:hypothetical protein